MFGIVIIGHGRLPQEFIAAVEHILGPQEAMKAVSITPQDIMDDKRADLMAAVESVKGTEGTVVLSDMFGGTPSNLAISLLDQMPVEVAAGLNLPMLIQLVRTREKMGMKEALLAAQEMGRKYIYVASDVLDQAG